MLRKSTDLFFKNIFSKNSKAFALYVQPQSQRNTLAGRFFAHPSSWYSTSTNTKGLTLTDSCVKQVNKISEEGSYLRVQVDSGGCSGFQYKFSLDAQITSEDSVFEKDGAKVVVDNDSLQLIDGSSIDYHHELIRSAFHIVSNPQAENGCSCGASFNVKI